MKFSLCRVASCAVVLSLAACDSKPKSDGAEAASGAKSGGSAGGVAASGDPASDEQLAGKSGPRDASAKPAAVTTASGLQYTVMKSGTGTVHPKATDTVTVHYHGTLLNGTVFDSSVDRGQPASFPLNRVIPGWTEGVQLMKQGDKFKFEIPADLAYGAAGSPPVIPPNSTLVFEVELLEIK